MSEYCNNCFCCGYYLVPRYKRLVNNIFPQNAQFGLDKNNLERLRFYAVVKPEKLDKSFRYMSEKIARYLRHQNRPYVILGIKAMNDTMKSCYEQLNTFVGYYLETLHLVLEERDDLELTEHAIASFESFCEIREEAPNYQRNYEFFVDRFTQLCHYNGESHTTEFRCLGLRGHHAFIRKTANDELQNDVWKHMNQIIPSIIFNMKIRKQDPSPTTAVSLDNVVITANDDPSALADVALRDLFNRAHHNNISACIKPILTHLDNHAKWIPVSFPKYIFSELMNSIKHHNSYVIIDLLLDHLEKHFDRKETINIKTSIMNVIHDCLVFAAMNEGTGYTMFAGISSLLKFLKKSFQIENRRAKASSDNQEEQQFRTAVINGIGDFAEKLPDFQMMEIMQYIASSIPTLKQIHEERREDLRDANLKCQLLLLRTIQKIAIEKHSRYSKHDSEATSTQTTFPHQLFDPLIKMMSTPQSDVRLIVLEILQLLVDKRHYADKLHKIRIPKNISQLGLPTETTTTRHFDIAFMKKFGRQFLSHLYECILMDNNTKEIFYAIYCLTNLVTIEGGDQDVLVDVIHFCFEIQSAIDENLRSSRTNYRCIHALIAAYFNITSKLYEITSFSRHVDEVIHNRELHAPYLLPPNAFRSDSRENLSKPIPKGCLFDERTVINALNALNYDTSRFNRVIQPGPEPDASGRKNYDETETDDSISIKTENENPADETVHNIFHAEESTRTNELLIHDFRTKGFEELKSFVNEKQKQTDQQIEQLLNVRSLQNGQAPITTTNDNPTSKGRSESYMNNFNYPELFLD